jgi:hypothetical protein
MRPKVVTVTTWLMAFSSLLTYSALYRRPYPRDVLLGMYVILTVLVVLSYFVLWFYWHGKNWARILILLASLVCFYNLSLLTSAKSGIERSMLVGDAILAAFLVYWLNTSEAKACFKRGSTLKT